MESSRIVVVGAGIVGVCCAAYLQRDGNSVTVIDPREPGDACSFGNAGLLATGGAAPEALPGILWQVPAMLRDPMGPLALNFGHLPRLAPWLLRFVANSRPAYVEAISKALAQLAVEVLSAYEPLLKSAGAQNLVEQRGWLHLYETQEAWDASQYGRELRRRRGVRIDDLGPDEIRQMVPATAPIFKRAAFFRDFAHTVNPKRLTQTLAASFAASGGTVRRGSVTGFETEADRVRAVLTNEGPIEVDGVVIAAGAWSRTLAEKLGSRLPLEAERGYHVMLPRPGVEIRMPLMSGESGFGLTPMEHGLRLAGTVEMAPLDHPPNPERPEAMLARARRMLPGLRAEGRTDWMGARPSFPDALPVIDRAPNFANAWFAFGHSHRGLSFAAVTGRTVAEMVSGRPTSIDTAPYRATRFSGLGWLFRPNPVPAQAA